MVCATRADTSGGRTGRVRDAQSATTANGTPSTRTAGRCNTRDATTVTAATNSARRCEGVGRHEEAERATGQPTCWVSRAEGVGTESRTSCTTEAPDTLLIHSSGRTVMRCSSTARATCLTSSGTT